MSDDTMFTSDKTMHMLSLVGFCDRYGTYEGQVWTLRADDVNRDNAVDASARLCTGILLSAFPEYQCDKMADDLVRLDKWVASQFGPFDGPTMSSAMDAVIYG
tara:strand:+ start:75 stop:383 length:309 start_codon:yes stop_codon:yes gene_type:complete